MSSNLSITSSATALTSASKSESPGKISSASKEFESLLLSQWLQGAETSFGSVPGGDEDQDSGDEQMKSFGVQQLARAITDAGGIGIANIISKNLARSAASVTATDKQDAQFLSRHK